MKCVFIVHTHIWVQYNPVAENMGIRSASVPVFVLLLSGPRMFKCRETLIDSGSCVLHCFWSGTYRI